jgi:hypothetical protein
LSLKQECKVWTGFIKKLFSIGYLKPLNIHGFSYTPYELQKEDNAQVFGFFTVRGNGCNGYYFHHRQYCDAAVSAVANGCPAQGGGQQS